MLQVSSNFFTIHEPFFQQESDFVLKVAVNDHNEPNVGPIASRLISYFEFSINTFSEDANCSFQDKSIRHNTPHCHDGYIELNISHRLVNSTSACPTVCETAVLVSRSPEQVIRIVIVIWVFLCRHLHFQ